MANAKKNRSSMHEAWVSMLKFYENSIFLNKQRMKKRLPLKELREVQRELRFYRQWVNILYALRDESKVVARSRRAARVFDSSKSAGAVEQK